MRRWIMGLFGKEWDPRTHAYLSKEWLRRRAQLDAEAIANWPGENGTCLRCNRPLSEHPPERALSADPSLCPK
jgi:hypothetical protein